MPLPKWELASGGEALCTECGARNRVRVFPALFSPRPAVVTQAALEGEATCFDHPSKRAVSACLQCGRFVCQLCAVEFSDGVWCPSCVAAGAGKARAARAETSRTLYDSMALAIPLCGLVLYPLMVVAAPAGLVLTAMKWSQPLGLVRRSRWRFVAAILLSLGELALCAAAVWLIVRVPAPRAR